MKPAEKREAVACFRAHLELLERRAWQDAGDDRKAAAAQKMRAAEPATKL